MKSDLPYILKAILLRLQGVKIPVRGSRISMSMGVGGTGRVIIGKTECRPHVYAACKKGGRLQLGDDVFINRNTLIICHNEIVIGDGTAIGPNVCIFDHDHKYGQEGMVKGFKEGRVRIGRNVWIGAGAIILRDTVIGDNCVIGAGCAVKGRIPANSRVIQRGKCIVSLL